MEYTNQSIKPEVFGCPFCHTVKNVTEAIDVDFAMQEPQWNKKMMLVNEVEVEVPHTGPPDFWRRTKTPMLICGDCAP